MPYKVAVRLNRVITADLLDWLTSFVMAKRSAGLSVRTVEFYQAGLTNFLQFCTSSGVTSVRLIDALTIRKYLLYLENTNHSPGGIHAKWRSVRAFFHWYEIEDYQPDWQNPVNKIRVKPPRLQPLEPADPQAVKAMLATCDIPVRSDMPYIGTRDKAIILMLLDTGLRANELLSLVVDNINPITGIIQVLHGKGDKPRVVYIGRNTRQALRKYLREVQPTDWLWLNIQGDKFTDSGLRQMLIERSKRAGVKFYSPHSFRRLFALTMLRAGVDIYSLQMLMGHADIQVLKRYLKLTQNDTLQAHLKGSPVEKLIR